MAVSIRPSLLSDLSSCQTTEGRISILSDIKNYIAGHELRKRQYVLEGLIPTVEALLRHETMRKEASRAELQLNAEVWNQTANIVCVIAHGGPAFVYPILESQIPAQLISRLSFESWSKQSLVMLRSLNAIAENLPLATPETWSADRRLADLLYADDNPDIFARTISRAGEDGQSQQACDAALALIARTCHEGRRKMILLQAGVLSALCERLATFVVTEGLVIPGLDARLLNTSASATIPQLAPSFAQLSPVLETIALLIEHSKHHAAQVLEHPAILAVLPSRSDDFSPSDIRKSPWGSTYFSGGAVPRSRTLTPIDLLLPRISEPDRAAAKDQSSFPPLGPSNLQPQRRSSSIRAAAEVPAASLPKEQDNEENENSLIPWLLYNVRAYRGRRRLAACRLLTAFYNHKLVNPSRARSFRTLLVPVLIKMLGDVVPHSIALQSASEIPYSHSVPTVLSRLIEDNLEMQKIAVNAKVIPKLAAALKATFEQQANNTVPLWKPQRQDSPTSPHGPLCSLGSGGPSLQARATMLLREGLLRALAAIAPYDDMYRKDICEQGALAQIVLSLEPFSSEVSLTNCDDPTLLATGNSTSTLLAACSAVRALTRSVTALRTKLVDAEVGKAIMKLMYNPDPEVRIAATKVVANLAMDFSPLKPTISEPDLIKKLCEQVHSANARLRLESIWALKLLVLNAANKLKKDVIDELGANWIRYLIKTDPYDIPPGDVIGLQEKDYPPRPVRSYDSGTADIVMSEDSDDELSMTMSYESASGDGKDYNKHTLEDDLEIQEQLIDLVRNLFCGETASEIVEYLLGEIGDEEFMDILIKRLRPKTLPGATRRGNQTSMPPRGIVVKVLYVIVHLAACAPRFRFMVSENQMLMRLVAGFCSHNDAEVRTQCCWIIINLTYEDDSSDREGCRQRATVLHRLGFSPLMRRLENDEEPNVRERAKTAVHLLDKLR